MTPRSDVRPGGDRSGRRNRRSVQRRRNRSQPAPAGSAEGERPSEPRGVQPRGCRPRTATVNWPVQGRRSVQRSKAAGPASSQSGGAAEWAGRAPGRACQPVGNRKACGHAISTHSFRLARRAARRARQPLAERVAGPRSGKRQATGVGRAKCNVLAQARSGHCTQPVPVEVFRQGRKPSWRATH
jgi:hypothetical protein